LKIKTLNLEIGETKDNKVRYKGKNGKEKYNLPPEKY
jgi:hypothetical protein